MTLKSMKSEGAPAVLSPALQKREEARAPSAPASDAYGLPPCLFPIPPFLSPSCPFLPSPSLSSPPIPSIPLSSLPIASLALPLA